MGDALDFEEFKAILEGKARPYTMEVMGMTLPNLAKFHDIPILGSITGATQDLLLNISYSLMGTAFAAAFGSLSEEELKKKFDELDTDKSGKLDAQEVATALRELKVNEADIKQIIVKMGKSEIDCDG